MAALKAGLAVLVVLPLLPLVLLVCLLDHDTWWGQRKDGTLTCGCLRCMYMNRQARRVCPCRSRECPGVSCPLRHAGGDSMAGVRQGREDAA